MRSDRKFQRNTCVEEIQVDQEWLLLHADRFTITRINELGGLCWSLLEEPASMEALAEEVMKHFVVSKEEALQDMERFMEELLAIDLVKPA